MRQKIQTTIKNKAKNNELRQETQTCNRDWGPAFRFVNPAFTKYSIY